VINHLPAVLVILLATLASFVTRKLSFPAALAGAIIATACYSGGGWRLLGCLAAFFFMSVLATRLGAGKKLVSGLAERDGGPRLAGQVFANGAVPAICSIAIVVFPDCSRLLLLAAAAGFASATADTLSSEIGNAYGSKYLDLVSLKPGIKGRNGVISMEGTLAGLSGTLVVAAISTARNGTAAEFLSIVVAGNLAGMFDSLLGGTLENKQLLTNNQVNLLNTAFGAAVSVLLSSIFR
jgi:uncharacterized protein (TIGR00297 family)